MKPEDVYRLIGRRLRTRRRILDMTQREVATKCGLTFQQVQKYEAGLVALPVSRLIALAEALQTSVGEILLGLEMGRDDLARDEPHWEQDRSGGMRPSGR